MAAGNSILTWNFLCNRRPWAKITSLVSDESRDWCNTKFIKKFQWASNIIFLLILVFVSLDSVEFTNEALAKQVRIKLCYILCHAAYCWYQATIFHITPISRMGTCTLREITVSEHTSSYDIRLPQTCMHMIINISVLLQRWYMSLSCVIYHT